MGVLTDSLDAYFSKSRAQLPPEVAGAMQEATEQLKASGIEAQAIGQGDLMPDFELPDQHGRVRRLYDYLKDSVLVLNVYRGGWCPYCNLEMKALHDALPQIEAHGARLVGMAPETAEKARTTLDNSGMNIDILGDEGNSISERLGLVFELPEVLRPIYQSFGIDIPGYNGDSSFKLPLPATYIVGRDGRVLHAYINADYTKRMEPEDIVAKLAMLEEAA